MIKILKLSVCLVILKIPYSLALAGVPAFKSESMTSLLNDVGTQMVNRVGDGTITVKKNEPYDESKDPALRKGTENWEETQTSFFVIPGAFLGIVGLLLFLNRDK
jgi:hypothetical protein